MVKKLSINTKNGIKTIKCFDFDGTYGSFKTIWNTIHNQMKLIALRYKEKYKLNTEFVEVSYDDSTVDAMWILDMWLCKDVDAAWEQALLIDGWTKEAINNRNIKEDFCLYSLCILIEDIISKRIIFKQLSINNNRSGSYLLIDPDNLIDGFYVSEMDFIDDLFLNEE